YQFIVQEPAAYISRDINWTTEDVILVSGGAKGITAECVLAWSARKKVKLALLGRSPKPDIQDKTNEIINTLSRLKEKDVVAAYYSCDITDKESLKQIIAQIEKELGSITGIIHGAAANIPGHVEQASLEQAIEQVSPKVCGIQNLLAILKNQELKLIAGFSSIIGVVGMPGNAWYAWSNETLNLILTEYQKNHPKTQIISLAYSVWDDVGMGVRMGSVNQLAKLGIAAIPKEEGVKRFVHLMENDPGSRQIIIAARLGGLDTWKPAVFNKPLACRFLEEIEYFEPGIELISRAHLSLQDDLYLVDHNFRDSYLFPTVFGLEAMGQAVAYVTGRPEFNSPLRLENISLEKPIIVDPEHGLSIQIHAKVQEKFAINDLPVIKVGISTEQTNFQIDHFSAVFVLDIQDKFISANINVPDKPLPLDPNELYGRILWQGSSFQRMLNVYSITEKETVVTSEIRENWTNQQIAYSGEKGTPFILGDPFFRDTMLHSGQLSIPKHLTLPITIGEIDIFSLLQQNSGLINAIITEETEGFFNTQVSALTKDLKYFELIKNYKTKKMEFIDTNPTVAELLKPEKSHKRLIKNELKKYCELFNISQPFLTVNRFSNIHSKKKEKRHQIERDFFQKALYEYSEDKKLNINAEKTYLDWHPSGKPVVKGNSEKIQVSFSHNEDLLVCALGEENQGCDIEEIKERDENLWNDILNNNSILLDILVKQGDQINKAGTRIWTAMEALHKVTEKSGGALEVIRKTGDAVMFQGTTDDGPVRILTLSMNLTSGQEQILSLVTPGAGQAVVKALPPGDTDFGYGDLLKTHHFEAREGSGPQGGGTFIHRFPVAFRPSSQLSRTVGFPNYFFWLGEVREIAGWPILKQVSLQCGTGKWGLVTNNTRIQILGEATTQDYIEINYWISGPANISSTNPVMDLTFDFRKILTGGGYERLAWCEQQVTWVKILDHGIVKPEPYPDYYWNFVKDLIPRYDAPNIAEPLPEPLADMKQDEDDREEY
ncbi:SDR family NAD(P)-dependent oxidoreductase, partial [bacterium]|nr:SDR family NAD(P)-dependent oxidoreductase [bacterium]